MSDVGARGDRHVWNPMARMADVLGQQRVWVRGEGSTLFDEDGREYLDGCASLWYANVGYGRTEIADAVAAQLRDLHAWMLFGPNLMPATVDLAERLARITPGDLDRIYFTCGGSESIEIAIKFARQYHRLCGAPGRTKLIARRGTYHGSTMGALSATGTPHNRRMYEPLVPGFRHVEPFSLEALEEAIELESPETVAAVLVEPSLAASGVFFPSPDYLPGVRALCDRFGILLISDEVICGFGRTGTWFGLDQWHVVPDVIAMAKGISSGYLPLGAVAISERLFAPFAEDTPDAGFYSGNTYAGHAACCVAGSVNLEIIEREGLVERSARVGLRLAARLAPLSDLELVAGVRAGPGLIAGVSLREPVAVAVAAAAFRRGVIVRALTDDALTVSPPLVISEAEVDRLADALGGAISEVEQAPAVLAHRSSHSHGGGGTA